VQLIDTGANLTHDSFDADRDEVILRAEEAGVSRMILTGASGQSSMDALVLAQSHPGKMFSTAGVHPHNASDYTDDIHQLLGRLSEHDAVVAVGECGLDFYRDFSPRDAQRMAFERQLEIAVRTKLPVFLHQRDAHGDFLEILRPRMPELSRAVAHCFTGDETQLRQYIAMDLYIGITGWICDERRGTHLQDIVGLIPDDRLLLETDAPYLLPRSLAPKPATRRNEPAYLREVLRVVASARRQTEEQVAAQTTAAAETFFNLTSKCGEPG
jgi:TatD DNase family protein